MATEEGLRRTANARQKRTRTKHERQAGEMFAAGWHSVTPEAVRAAVAELEAIPDDDPEKAHGSADDVLLKVVPVEVLAAFEALRERTRGFWYA